MRSLRSENILHADGDLSVVLKHSDLLGLEE